MQQHAIELVRFQAPVLQHQNTAASVEFPRSANRCFDQSNASAQQRSYGRAARQRFPAQRRGPAAIGRGHRAHESIRIVPPGGIGALVKAAGHERTVKSDPMKFLPQKNVDRRQIAEPAKNPGPLHPRDLQAFQKFRAAVPAARAEHASNLTTNQGILQLRPPRFQRRGKISFRLALPGLFHHPIVHLCQVFAPPGDALRLGRTCRSNNGDRASRDQCWRLERFRHGRGPKNKSIQRARRAHGRSVKRPLPWLPTTCRQTAARPGSR